MFPSSNSTDNTFESSLFRKALFCDQNPINKQDEPPIFFSNFPSPFFDEHELPLNQMLSHSLQMGGSSFLTFQNHESHNLDPDVGIIENCTPSISCPNPDFQCSAAASPVFTSRTEINSNVLGFLGNWDLRTID